MKPLCPRCNMKKLVSIFISVFGNTWYHCKGCNVYFDEYQEIVTQEELDRINDELP